MSFLRLSVLFSDKGVVGGGGGRYGCCSYVRLLLLRRNRDLGQQEDENETVGGALYGETITDHTSALDSMGRA